MILYPGKITAVLLNSYGGKNVAAGASVSITDTSGKLTRLFNDKDGFKALPNPFFCDANGEKQFWCDSPDGYNVNIFSPFGGWGSWGPNKPEPDDGGGEGPGSDIPLRHLVYAGEADGYPAISFTVDPVTGNVLDIYQSYSLRDSEGSAYEGNMIIKAIIGNYCVCRVSTGALGVYLAILPYRKNNEILKSSAWNSTYLTEGDDFTFIYKDWWNADVMAIGEGKFLLLQNAIDGSTGDLDIGDVYNLNIINYTSPSDWSQQQIPVSLSTISVDGEFDGNQWHFSAIDYESGIIGSHLFYVPNGEDVHHSLIFSVNLETDTITKVLTQQAQDTEFGDYNAASVLAALEPTNESIFYCGNNVRNNTVDGYEEFFRSANGYALRYQYQFTGSEIIHSFGSAAYGSRAINESNQTVYSDVTEFIVFDVPQMLYDKMTALGMDYDFDSSVSLYEMTSYSIAYS